MYLAVLTSDPFLTRVHRGVSKHLYCMYSCDSHQSVLSSRLSCISANISEIMANSPFSHGALMSTIHKHRIFIIFLQFCVLCVVSTLGAPTPNNIYLVISWTFSSLIVYQTRYLLHLFFSAYFRSPHWLHPTPCPLQPDISGRLSAGLFSEK